jgi:hypothetical protein
MMSPAYVAAHARAGTLAAILARVPLDVLARELERLWCAELELVAARAALARREARR